MALPVPRLPIDVERLAGRAANQALTTMASAVEAFVAALDLDAIFAAVDLDAILRRVDIQSVIDRIDINTVIGRVDMNALVARLDVNELIARIDLEAIVEDTDVGAVIARSTGNVASGAVDLVRRQGVGLDDAVARLAQRLRPRRLSEVPDGPTARIAGPVAT